MICQSTSSQRENTPLEEIDVPSYPFERIRMDVSDPYGEINI